MAGKAKSVYICSECGYESPKWFGCCPGCGEWNTMNEEIKAPVAAAAKSVANARSVKTYALSEITADEEIRYQTGLTELDRVLGGGIVKGSLVLLSGDPGIGKSTILLQICQYIGKNLDILYVSGEESVYQIKLRADRLGVTSPTLTLMSQTDVQAICEYININKPGLVIIDSIQTMVISELNSSAGSVTQVRECSARLTRLAKTTGTTLFFVGHVTKEGALAGPRVLEHIVDTVLYFEGDTHSNFRLVRAFKNRFGAVNELGVFAMTDRGLRGISNPSAIFLSEHRENVPGSVVMVTQEGTRPLLVEVQALVDGSHLPSPKRLSVGLDQQRLSMLIAVLHRHAGIGCYDQDVFVNAVGGVKITEPASDLAVMLAIAGSIGNRAMPAGLVVFGEAGLAGEIRPAPRGQERLKEAAKLGFSKAIIPRANAPKTPIEGVEDIAVDRLTDAIAAARATA